MGDTMIEVVANNVRKTLSRVPFLEITGTSSVVGSNYTQVTYVLRVPETKKAPWYDLISKLLGAESKHWQPYVAQRYMLANKKLLYRWELVFKVVDTENFERQIDEITQPFTREAKTIKTQIKLPWVPEGDRNVPDEKGRGVFRIGSLGSLDKIGLSS